MTNQFGYNLSHTGIGMILAATLTGLSYLVGLQAGWIESINNLEVFAVLTSYLCTYLCVVQSRWNYPIGVVTVVAYAWLFYEAQLLASMALNIYLVIPLIYGFWRWGSRVDSLKVTHLKPDIWLVGYLAIVCFAYYIGTQIVFYLGGTMPWADGVILFGSIFAQLLLDNKKIETWAVWAIVNVFAIWLYSTQGLYLVAFQYVFFLANTGYGAYQWHKTMNNQKPMEVFGR